VAFLASAAVLGLARSPVRANVVFGE
jgi:hypothetical protein